MYDDDGMMAEILDPEANWLFYFSKDNRWFATTGECSECEDNDNDGFGADPPFYSCANYPEADCDDIPSSVCENLEASGELDCNIHTGCAQCINPDAPEVCDSFDNDCNSFVDETFDNDGDGYFPSPPCTG